MYKNKLVPFIQKHCSVDSIIKIAEEFEVIGYDSSEFDGIYRIKAPVIVFDFETDKLKAEKVLCFSFMDVNQKLIHWFSTRDIELNAISDGLKNLFNHCQLLIAHNLKFEIMVLKRLLNIKKFPELYDTMTAWHLIEEKRPSFSLKNIVCDVFGFDDWSADIDYKNLEEVDESDLFVYNVIDVFTCYLLYSFSNKRINNNYLKKLVSEIPIMLEEMEFYGMKVNTEYVREEMIKKEMELERTRNKLMKMKAIRHTREIKLELLRRKASKQSKLLNTEKLPAFNPASNDDVRLLLTRVLKADVKKKTKKGAVSVDVSVLREINTKETRAILKYRELNKLLSTYLRPYTRVEKISSDYNPVATTSGRLSSSNPNLQNIPKELRRIFIPRDGYVFVELDVARAEALMFAILSGDKETLNIIEKGDFHRWVASLVFGKPEKEITSTERNIAKTATFAILYMASPQGLIEGLQKKANIKINEKKAVKIIEAYRRRLPILSYYQNKCINFVQKNHYISNIFGRKRRFLILKYLPINLDIMKQAVNHTVQSSLSDLFISFLVFIVKSKDNDDDFRLVNSVHDSAVFEVKRDKLDNFYEWMGAKAKEFSQFLLNYDIKLPTKIKLETKIGTNWYSLAEHKDVFIPANV